MTKSRTALLLALVVVAAVSSVDTAWAQGTPFGAPHPTANMSASGLAGWIFAKQAEFYRSLSGYIRACKDDGTATWSLFVISLLYGVFHAVGPGHGKAVISSYLVANRETWRRGVVLSFASASLQSAVAIVIVTIAALLLDTTAAAIGTAVHVVEIMSYGLVVLIGLRLVFVKGRAFAVACRDVAWQEPPALAVASGLSGEHLRPPVPPARAMAMRPGRCQAPGCGHVHDLNCQAHDYHESAWGHAHGPEPAELAGTGGWQRGLSAVVAVGLRPCSGAIILLVFALAQDLFWTGVGATLLMGLGTAVTVAAIATLAVSAREIAGRVAKAQAGFGMLAIRALEVGASVAIVAFGALLLAGYMATEQLWMFAR
ncbi:nickel/cobalt transporter [Bradyrhizobium commune]